jgi:hypothetical protein
MRLLIQPFGFAGTVRRSVFCKSLFFFWTVSNIHAESPGVYLIKTMLTQVFVGFSLDENKKAHKSTRRWVV